MPEVHICTCGHSKQAHAKGVCVLCGNRHAFVDSGRTRHVNPYPKPKNDVEHQRNIVDAESNHLRSERRG